MRKIFILFAVLAFAMTAKAQAPALMSASFDKETDIITVELDNGETTITSFKFIFRLPEGVTIKTVYDEEEEEDVQQILKVSKRVPKNKVWNIQPTTGDKAGATMLTCYDGNPVKNSADTKAIVTIQIAGKGAGLVEFTEAQVMMDGVETNLADFNCEVATAIKSIKAEETKSGAIYNVNGQRVSKATKGVYVIDGKKYTVK
jgi:hypothetical protein